MNYNTTLSLWENFKVTRSKMPNGGAILQVVDGHISDGLQILARFDNDSHAERTLKQAGFKRLKQRHWK